jgi:gamma-glutamylcyclotransferase (GGCT)/AIG2-like uncharacterized protein YtfP
LGHTASNWWKGENSRPYLIDAVNHINQARGRDERDHVERCGALFGAFNKLWMAHGRVHEEFELSDHSAFKHLVLAGMDEGAKEVLCRSMEVEKLVKFNERILNQRMLNTSRAYRPGHPLRPQLKKKASEAHAQLAKKWATYTGRSDTASRDSLIGRLAELLYIVRSNIAHGEKTLKGPDPAKAIRDQQVCAAVLPLLELVVECVLEYPARRLAVYGSLAPGRPNHSMLAPLGGEWRRGIIEGQIEVVDGFEYFKWVTKSNKVVVHILDTDQLRDQWATLDSFEGPLYRRVLCPVEIDEDIAIVNVYTRSS